MGDFCLWGEICLGNVRIECAHTRSNCNWLSLDMQSCLALDFIGGVCVRAFPLFLSSSVFHWKMTVERMMMMMCGDVGLVFYWNRGVWMEVYALRSVCFVFREYISKVGKDVCSGSIHCECVCTTCVQIT